MIQQQCYTRERKGLFNRAEGYDSVAKSEGLEDTFIKDFLHPFCGYSPSRVLQAEGAGADEYPKTLTLIRCPDGRTVFGQSTYVDHDFTGQRPTFFIHNYVLPHTYTLDIPCALYDTVFLTAYDLEAGPRLPELTELPVKQNAPLTAPYETIKKLGITQPEFNTLINCLLQSAAGTKKTYIIPPVGIRETAECAREFLTALYPYLPPALIKTLGFTTYNREPENKKGLHLLFLEKGAIRPGDPRISRDFFIDIGQGHWPKLEQLQEDSAYLTYIWKKLSRNESIEPFYAFANTFPEALTLKHWDNITVIYHAYKNITQVECRDTREKQCLLSIVKNYLPYFTSNQLEITQSTDESVPTAELLASFAARLVLHEAAALGNDGYVSTRGIITEIAGYFPFPMPENPVAKTIYRYALVNPREVFFITDLVRKIDTAFLQEFIAILSSKKELNMLEGYYTECFRQLDICALIDEAHFWFTNAPEAFRDPVFNRCLLERTDALMYAAEDIVREAASAYGVLDVFRENADAFLSGLMDCINTRFLSRLDFDAITREQLAVLPDALIKRGRESNAPAPYIKLYVLKKLSNLPDTGEAVNIRFFLGSYKLDADARCFILRKLREFYRVYIEPKQFKNIVSLFQETNQTDTNTLLRYIDEYGGVNKGPFLTWAVAERIFIPQNPIQRDELRMFIKDNIKDDAFKDIIYANADLKVLAKETRFGRLAHIH